MATIRYGGHKTRLTGPPGPLRIQSKFEASVVLLDRGTSDPALPTTSARAIRFTSQPIRTSCIYFLTQRPSSSDLASHHSTVSRAFVANDLRRTLQYQTQKYSASSKTHKHSSQRRHHQPRFQRLTRVFDDPTSLTSRSNSFAM